MCVFVCVHEGAVHALEAHCYSRYTPFLFSFVRSFARSKHQPASFATDFIYYVSGRGWAGGFVAGIKLPIPRRQTAHRLYICFGFSFRKAFFGAPHCLLHFFRLAVLSSISVECQRSEAAAPGPWKKRSWILLVQRTTPASVWCVHRRHCCYKISNFFPSNFFLFRSVLYLKTASPCLALAMASHRTRRVIYSNTALPALQFVMLLECCTCTHNVYTFWVLPLPLTTHINFACLIPCVSFAFLTYFPSLTNTTKHAQHSTHTQLQMTSYRCAPPKQRTNIFIYTTHFTFRHNTKKRWLLRLRPSAATAIVLVVAIVLWTHTHKPTILYTKFVGVEGKYKFPGGR